MLEKAIEKLQGEMDRDKNNAYVQVVGNQIIKFLKKNNDAAERFLPEDKSIAKSLDHMRSEATKKKNNGFAMFTLEEGLEIVFRYFGINIKPEMEVPEPTFEYKETVPKETKKIDFDIKLEDFLS